MDSKEKLGQDRELKIIKEIDHPFVIKYYDEFEYRKDAIKKICIVSQLANGGNLESLMKRKKIFTEDEGMYYFTMILIGLHYLHSKQIIHRDLKPENILIDNLGEGVDVLLIGDFGLSK